MYILHYVKIENPPDNKTKNGLLTYVYCIRL